MKALISGVVSVAMLLCGAGIISEAHATTPPVTWGAKTLENQTGHGDGIPVEVWGPPNGSYSVVVTELPFNSSPPVATYSERLPTMAVTPAGEAYGNFSVPTRMLNYGPAQIRVANGTIGSFSVSTVLVTTQANESGLQDQITQLWFVVNATTQQLRNFANEIQYQYFLWQVAIGFVATGFIALALAILFTGTKLRYSRTGAKIQRAYERMNESSLWRPNAEAGTVSTEPVPAPRPSHSFVGTVYAVGQCAVCDTPQSEKSIQDHQSFAHAIADPGLGRTYRMDMRLARDMAAYRTVPSLAPRRMARPTVTELFRG